MSKRLLKSIYALQRMKQMTLEELQRQLAGMREREESLKAELVYLQSEVENEYKCSTLLLLPSNQAYFHKNKARQAVVEQLLSILLIEMEAVEGQLKEVYMEKKRLESVEKTTIDKINLQEKSVDQRNLDEISSIMHLKNS